MPHLHETKFDVLNLYFWSEAHALSCLMYLIFSLNLCLEVRHISHLYQTKFYVLNLYLWDEARALSYLIDLIFFLKLVLRGEARVSPL